MIIKNRVTIDRENELSLYTNKYHADPSQSVFPELVDDFRFVVCAARTRCNRRRRSRFGGCSISDFFRLQHRGIWNALTINAIGSANGKKRKRFWNGSSCTKQKKTCTDENDAVKVDANGVRKKSEKGRTDSPRRRNTWARRRTGRDLRDAIGWRECRVWGKRARARKRGSQKL